MRNYFEFFFGTFHEHSTSLGIDIDVNIFTRTAEEASARVDQLNQDIEQAGGDWTGTLTFGIVPAYVLMSKDNLFSFVQNFFGFGNTIQTMIANGQASFESPRGKEKRKFKLVPIRR